MYKYRLNTRDAHTNMNDSQNKGNVLPIHLDRFVGRMFDAQRSTITTVRGFADAHSSEQSTAQSHTLEQCYVARRPFQINDFLGAHANHPIDSHTKPPHTNQAR